MSKGRGEGVGWMRKVVRVQRSKNPRGAKLLEAHIRDHLLHEKRVQGEAKNIFIT